MKWISVIVVSLFFLVVGMYLYFLAAEKPCPFPSDFEKGIGNFSNYYLTNLQ